MLISTQKTINKEIPAMLRKRESLFSSPFNSEPANCFKKKPQRVVILLTVIWKKNLSSATFVFKRKLKCLWRNCQWGVEGAYHSLKTFGKILLFSREIHKNPWKSRCWRKSSALFRHSDTLLVIVQFNDRRRLARLWHLQLALNCGAIAKARLPNLTRWIDLVATNASWSPCDDENFKTNLVCNQILRSL